MILKIEGIFSTLAIMLYFLKGYKWTWDTRDIAVVAFEMCNLVPFLGIIISQRRSNGDGFVLINLDIIYALISSCISTSLIFVIAFLLGAPLLNLGTFLISIYLGIIAFKSCCISGYKNVLKMMINSSFPFPENLMLSPFYYSCLFAYLFSFFIAMDWPINWRIWPHPLITGTIFGKFIGMIYISIITDFQIEKKNL
ncbi:hypothetical protein ACR3K2_12590 [Cryptosporidium serpentis]